MGKNKSKCPNGFKLVSLSYNLVQKLSNRVKNINVKTIYIPSIFLRSTYKSQNTKSTYLHHTAGLHDNSPYILTFKVKLCTLLKRSSLLKTF